MVQAKILIPLVVLTSLAFAAVAAPWIAPNDPLAVSMTRRLQGWSTEFPLGTDHLGRCVVSRLLWGARVSLGVAFIVSLATVLIGLAVGMIAGYCRGRAEIALMLLTDFILTLPTLVLALAILGLLGPGLDNAMLAIVAVHWAHYARSIRAMTLTIRQQEFVAAAVVIGRSHAAIVLRHILPNLGPMLSVIVTLDAGWILLQVSGFSFLGLGVEPPTPELGMMIFEARQYFRDHPALILAPGAVIFATVVSLNVLGDALTDWQSRL